jgi:hypothetical protein
MSYSSREYYVMSTSTLNLKVKEAVDIKDIQESLRNALTALAKTKVKWRVSFTRAAGNPTPGMPAPLEEQTTFFCVDRASVIRLTQILMWDITVTSMYVDEHDAEVLSSLVRE